MPLPNTLSHMIPALTDAADANKAFDDFSKSLHSIIPVANATEAAQVAADTPAESFPLFFYIGDALYAQESKTGGRIVIGGRRANIQTDVAVAVDSGATGRFLQSSNIVRSTPGWELSTDKTSLVVPQAGFYIIQAELLATEAGQKDKTVSATGEQNIRIYAGAFSAIANVPNSMRSHVLMIGWLSAGSNIRAHYSHTAGRQLSVWGSVQAVQLAS